MLVLAGVVCGQTPRIGVIDFYGLRKVSQARVRKALGFGEGDPLPPSKGDVEERLAKVPGVVAAHLEATCCLAGKLVLYVGIEEKGAPHFDTHTPPDQDIALPKEITDAYGKFLQAVNQAAHRGNTSEDLTYGHSLMADPDARDIQLHFVDLADRYLKDLRNVLHNAADPDQRAIAAYVIGYAPAKTAIVNDLQWALQDSDENVRSNAIRAITALAVFAKLRPASGITVEPTWFIEMLNSISWNDRKNAAVALVSLTDSRDPATLAEIRNRAMLSLVEMARWHQLEHALPAYILLGRVAGMPEKQIQKTWSDGQREQTIARIAKKFKVG
jgi:HEAT repeats